MSRISRLRPVTAADLKKDFHLAIPLPEYNWMVQNHFDPKSLLLRKIHELQKEEAAADEEALPEVIAQAIAKHSPDDVPKLTPEEARAYVQWLMDNKEFQALPVKERIEKFRSLRS